MCDETKQLPGACAQTFSTETTTGTAAPSPFASGGWPELPGFSPFVGMAGAGGPEYFRPHPAQIGMVYGHPPAAIFTTRPRHVPNYSTAPTAAQTEAMHALAIELAQLTRDRPDAETVPVWSAFLNLYTALTGPTQ